MNKQELEYDMRDIKIEQRVNCTVEIRKFQFKKRKGSNEVRKGSNEVKKIQKELKVVQTRAD